MKDTGDVEFIGLYFIPGEGTVAALKVLQETQLFDKQGLEYRIVEKKKTSTDTSVEELALAQVKQNDGQANGFI